MAHPLNRPQLVKREQAALPLDRALLIQIHELMVEARALEERLIRMYRQGQGFFWIGGPGEDGFYAAFRPLIQQRGGLYYHDLHAHHPHTTDESAPTDY